MSINTPPLEVDIGTELNIGFEGISIQVTSTLVGMITNEYLIISPPNPLSSIKPKLFPGNIVVIKFLFNGNIYVFKTKIIEYISKPQKLVFLEYPSEMIQKNIRSVPRTSCYIPCNIKFKRAVHIGVITDISENGCGNCIKVLPVNRNFIPIKEDQVQLECQFFGAMDEFEIKGSVRNIQKKGAKYIVGIRFESVNGEVFNRIKKYHEFIREFL
ncbi:MAG: flagellar brake protein [Desulfobacterales bacterium]|nr:flagellar brake protein [Desulfobacterales bacterium]